MIELYTGFVGSGKSYHAVARGCAIADAPLGDRWVIANFPIKPKKRFKARLPFLRVQRRDMYNEPRWIYRPDEYLTVDWLIETSHEKGFYGNESSCLLIFDEAGITFNARDWNIKPDERKKWIKFFSQSRKFGYDVIFIAQDMRMIDRQIRSLCEYEVVHKKINNFSIFKLLPFSVFAYVSFWNGVRHVRGSLELGVYRKSVAKRYDTMRIFNWDEAMSDGGW